MVSTLPVLHVGFHKCGSTTLQGALFSRHSGIANLGEPEEDPDALTAFRNALLACHELKHKNRPFDVDESRMRWQRALARHPADKVPVFSKETLTLCEYYHGADDRRLPQMIHDIVGPARIVIMARHQIRLIESLYLYLAKGYNIEAPDAWLAANTDTTRMYRFHTIASMFADIFGRENVRVMLLEDLQSDAQAFARTMCSFIGVDPEEGARLLAKERKNARVSERYYRYSMLRKRLGLYVPFGKMLPKQARDAFNAYMRSGKGADVSFAAPSVAGLEDYYRADNRHLAEAWQLPLARYGYPL
jgi:hypothetical protein